jgi:hypothetical protein
VKGTPQAYWSSGSRFFETALQTRLGDEGVGAVGEREGVKD